MTGMPMTNPVVSPTVGVVLMLVEWMGVNGMTLEFDSLGGLGIALLNATDPYLMVNPLFEHDRNNLVAVQA